jgi:hypothetical protein
MSFLDPKAASAYLREKYAISLSPKWLANRRNRGRDPRFVRFMRRWPRYTPQWLDDFALGRDAGISPPMCCGDDETPDMAPEPDALDGGAGT